MPKPFSKHFLAALLLVSACISGPARAQDAAAPFDGELQRLAEILGTLHYLRGICGTNEGLKWRNEMQALVDAETSIRAARKCLEKGFENGLDMKGSGTALICLFNALEARHRPPQTRPGAGAGPPR